MKYLLLLAIVLGSCQISKPRAKKKLDCIVQLYPELIDRDTVTIHDTTVTERIVKVPEYRDSFIIEHDTLIETREIIVEKTGTKYRFIVKEKEVRVVDTFYSEVKVPGKVVRIVEPYPKENIIIFILIGFIVGAFTVVYIRPHR